MAGQEKQSKGSKAGRNKTCVVYKAEDRRLRNKLRRLVTYLNRNYRRAKSKRETGIDYQARSAYKRLSGQEYNEQWAN